VIFPASAVPVSASVAAAGDAFSFSANLLCARSLILSRTCCGRAQAIDVLLNAAGKDFAPHRVEDEVDSLPPSELGCGDESASPATRTIWSACFLYATDAISSPIFMSMPFGMERCGRTAEGRLREYNDYRESLKKIDGSGPRPKVVKHKVNLRSWSALSQPGDRACSSFSDPSTESNKLAVG
jgi:hypothetical protein